MRRYLLRKIVTALIVLLAISLIVFALIELQPGNPYSFMMSPNTSPEVYEEMLEKLGYYDPFIIKYLAWLGRFLMGDMGYSIVTGQAVATMIVERLGSSLLLSVTSMVVSFILGTLIGCFTAFNHDKWMDQMISFGSIVVMSVPAFFIGLILIKVFSFDLNWLPASGIQNVRSNSSGWDHILDVARHLLLPVMTLSATQISFFQRYIRANVIEVMRAPYIKTAMSKGLTYREAVVRHGSKNILIPILTLFFLQLPSAFSGALITETIFVWPGMGKLTYDAVLRRDYMVIMGVLMVSSIIVLTSNLFADLTYSLIDKRIERS